VALEVAAGLLVALDVGFAVAFGLVVALAVTLAVALGVGFLEAARAVGLEIARAAIRKSAVSRDPT
jgi:hypothetical protein